MSERPVAITVKAISVVAAMALAFVATGLQLDRQSRHNADLAPWVPAVFRGQALQVMAQRAYASGNPGQGLTYARELVRRRPIPAEGLSLLARGLIASGNQDKALSALSLASQRGWRDVFTQQLSAASALDVGERQVAAQRLLALWRMGYRDADTDTMTLQLLSDNDGLRAFSTSLVSTDGWGTDFLLWAARDGFPAQPWTTLGKAFNHSNAKLDCERLASPIRSWAMTGQSAAALAAWTDLCSPGRAISANQFEFTQMSDTPGPFEWNYPTQVGLEIDLVENAGGVTLKYDYSDYIRTPIATRPAALTPGLKTAKLDIGTDGTAQSGQIGLQVTCFSARNQARRVAQAWFESGRVTFQIPSSECVGQELTLFVNHGGGTLQALKIDDASQ